ncbi:MAG: rhodanese-like domain-containing protein [Candidatus Izemoplasmatales bacterium]
MFLAEFKVTDYIIPIILGVGIGLVIAFWRNSKGIKATYLVPEDFRANMRKGQLIDIRSKEEFTKERINGSRNFPKRTVFQSMHLLRADQPVFIYANQDKGIVKAVGRKLMKKGFHTVYILSGGFENWPYPKK